MIRVIGNEKQRALEWAAGRWGMTIDADEWGAYSAMILEKDGDIQAAVLFKGYLPKNSSIEVHLAAVSGGRWLTRPFLRAAFEYPFGQLGVRRITALIAADNLPSIRWTEHCGFTREGVVREGWSETVDLFVYGLLKRECRFLGGSIGKSIGTNASRSSRSWGGPNGVQSGDGDQQCGTQPRQHQHPLWEPNLQHRDALRRWHA